MTIDQYETVARIYETVARIYYNCVIIIDQKWSIVEGVS